MFTTLMYIIKPHHLWLSRRLSYRPPAPPQSQLSFSPRAGDSTRLYFTAQSDVLRMYLHCSSRLRGLVHMSMIAALRYRVRILYHSYKYSRSRVLSTASFAFHQWPHVHIDTISLPAHFLFHALCVILSRPTGFLDASMVFSAILISRISLYFSIIFFNFLLVL